jgi:acetyltransferase EpsM
MTQRRLLIFGASGHGKVVADSATQSGWQVLGFADDNAALRSQVLLGYSVIATGQAEAVALCRQHDAEFVVGIGNNAIRRRIFLALREAGASPATVIHPRATIADSCTVGAGTVVFAGVAINPDSSLGCNVIVNTSASIDHDNVLGDHVHVSPGVHCGGTVTIGEGTHVGIGASVRNNIEVGAWSVIGAGAVVVRHLPAQVVAYGVPARVMRRADG